MPESHENKKCKLENASNELPSDFVHPDLPSKCTWKLGTTEPSPHTQRPLSERPKVLPHILDAIGQSPLVKLNRLPQSEGIKCEMYAKCEFLNPGGSVKDRIGYRMVLDAEENGILKPGCTIIEPTSGNTGIGLAMACAVRGYRCIIVMPDKMSNEKVSTLKVLGAEIIRTPIEAAFDSPDGLIAVAQKLQKEIPNSFILNQYTNASNPLAHYDGTASEILYQLDNQVDMIICGAGTGGTITGIGRKIKEKQPNCIIVGVDPYGSILAQPEELNKTDISLYEIEGIGYDFIPTVLDRSVVDQWIKTTDKESLPMARRLMKEEGLLCGGSSGSAMIAAIKAAKILKENQKCVIILPDGIRNYMTKFVQDSWMEARNFQESININQYSWWDIKASELNLPLPKIIKPTILIKDAIDMMKNENLQEIPVVDDNGNILGAVTQDILINQLISTNRNVTDTIAKAIYKKAIKLPIQTNLGKLARVLDAENFVILTNEEINDGKKIQKIVALIKKFDILNLVNKDLSINGSQKTN